jgi:hypothetical protein
LLQCLTETLRQRLRQPSDNLWEKSGMEVEGNKVIFAAQVTAY